ncbi:MAG: transporter substrate-binding domain-containing protein [Clostridia bacterium]|nr:transporter substrate-binding domain-containing protein [Clostridia bacterium]
MKRIIIASLLIVVLVASCLTVFAACNNKEDWEYIEDKGTLIVGVTDYEPMDYQDASGKWIGFDADVARAVGEKLGLEVEFVEIDWDEKIVELKSKKIDVIWNGMTVTEELGKEMDFSYSYAKNSQVIVTASANLEKYSTVQKITAENASVAVESGSAGEKVAQATFANATITDVQGQVKALTEVKMGTSDVAIVDYTLAASKCGTGNFDNLSVIPGIEFEEEEFAVGIRKGSKLTEKINAALVELYNDGTIESIRQKYDPDAIALLDLSKAK